MPARRWWRQHGKQLTLAVVSGVEGDALKDAARDYEAQTGVHINIAEFPYANLFEKELIDLNARTGAYDLIMLDDPWFPKFATQDSLTDLAPLYEKRGIKGPDGDFVPSSIALCRHPYQSGALYALPYVGNSQLFFYRKDIFEKHNLKEPATWDEVLAAARTISERETAGAPDGGRMHGYVMRAAQGNAVVADFMPIFWAYANERSAPPSCEQGTAISAGTSIFPTESRCSSCTSRSVGHDVTGKWFEEVLVRFVEHALFGAPMRRPPGSDRRRARQRAAGDRICFQAAVEVCKAGRPKMGKTGCSGCVEVRSSFLQTSSRRYEVVRTKFSSDWVLASAWASCSSRSTLICCFDVSRQHVDKLRRALPNRVFRTVPKGLAADQFSECRTRPQIPSLRDGEPTKGQMCCPLGWHG